MALLISVAHKNEERLVSEKGTLALTTLLFCTVLTTLMLPALLWARAKQHIWVVGLTKSVASLGFVIAGFVYADLNQAAHIAMLFGFLLCFFGDLLLVASDKRIFLVGLFGFLLGHIAFSSAFFLRGWGWPGLQWAGFAALPLGALVFWWLWPHLSKSMTIPVFSYVAVIVVMCSMAGATVGAQGARLLLIGAFSFALSDVAVARQRFVAPGLINRLWGLPLYYAAQFLFCFSIALGEF